MVNEKIRELMANIKTLEEELRQAVQEQEAHALGKLHDKRIEIKASIDQTQRRLKTGFFRWLVTYHPQNLITGPVIYVMILPLAMTDLCVSFYQFTCFPIYGIAKVRRRDYFVYDRQHLPYLNFIEKFHCTYCAYANGLMAYMQEILARTEEYFCPIKHAQKRPGTHARYSHFLDYGQAVDYEAELEKYRQGLGIPHPPEEK